VRKNRGQLPGLHADLPPIPLHDLRHSAPSSGIVLTVDTYTSVLPDLAHHAAKSLSWASTSLSRLHPKATSSESALPAIRATMNATRSWCGYSRLSPSPSVR
jgi:hypothetical protein